MPDEHVCPWWLAYTFDHAGRNLFQRPSKVAGPYVKPGMTAMDIGCGMGFFSIGMARMVGGDGLVIAVDLQQKMLEVLMKRAKRKGVAGRIRAHRCGMDTMGIDEPVDFALACYMVHEVPDQKGLLSQIRACLKPQGRFLIIEPGWHVKKENFDRTLDLAEAAGLRLVDQPRTRWDRTALFGPA